MRWLSDLLRHADYALFTATARQQASNLTHYAYSSLPDRQAFHKYDVHFIPNAYFNLVCMRILFFTLIHLSLSVPGCLSTPNGRFVVPSSFTESAEIFHIFTDETCNSECWV